MPRYLVGAPAYLNKHGRPKHPLHLAEHRCIGYSYTMTADTWRFTKNGKSATVRPSGPLRVNNGDAMLPALIAGTSRIRLFVGSWLTVTNPSRPRGARLWVSALRQSTPAHRQARPSLALPQWIWRGVADRLRAAGHAVTTPTLSGLGDRRHVGQDADLDTHIQDVITHIEMEGLEGVTLVGWSYGGMVITGVLSRIPHKDKGDDLLRRIRSRKRQGVD
jgi:hypothetical protein